MDGCSPKLTVHKVNTSGKTQEEKLQHYILLQSKMIPDMSTRK